jgi:hypothetical protein
MGFQDDYSAADLPLLSRAVASQPVLDLPVRLTRQVDPKSFPLKGAKALAAAVFAQEKKLDYLGSELTEASLLSLLGDGEVTVRDPVEALDAFNGAIVKWLARSGAAVVPERRAETFDPPLPAEWPPNWGRVNSEATSPWPVRG